MKCQTCGTDNMENNKFCSSCGAKLEAKSEAPKQNPEIKTTQATEPTPIQNPNPASVQNPQASEIPETPRVSPAEETPIAPSVNINGQAYTPYVGKPYTPAAQKDKKERIPLHISKQQAISILIAAIVVILVVGGIVIGRRASAGNGYSPVMRHIEYVYKPADENSLFFFDGAQVDVVDGSIRAFYECRNGGVAYAINEDDTLFLVTKKQITKLAEDVESAEISDNGNVLVYLDAWDTLYSLDLEKKKLESLSEETAWYDLDGYKCYAISPDGKTVMFTTEEDDSFTTHIWNRGEMRELEDCIGLVTTDNADTVYCFGEDESIYAYHFKKDEIIKLAPDTDGLFMNKKCNEMIFSYSDKYYLSIDGGERIRLGKYDNIYPILPRNNPYQHIYSEVNTIQMICGSVTYNIDTFIGTMMLFTDDDDNYSIGYIDKNYEVQTVVDKVDLKSGYSVQATQDLKTIFYVARNSMYMINEKNDYVPEKIASGLDLSESGYPELYIKASPDGKRIYYVDEDKILYCLQDGNKTEIADEVLYSTLGMTDDGVLYYLADAESYDYNTFDNTKQNGVLYRCANGKNPIRVADDVSVVNVEKNHVVYFTAVSDSDFISDMYVSTDGKTFTKAAEDISLVVDP